MLVMLCLAIFSGNAAAQTTTLVVDYELLVYSKGLKLSGPERMLALFAYRCIAHPNQDETYLRFQDSP